MHYCRSTYTNKFLEKFVKTLIMPLALTTFVFTSGAQGAELGRSATDQIIVKLAERSNGMAAAQNLSKQTGQPLRFLRNTRDGRYIFRLPEPALNSAATKLASAMMNSPSVLYAEADLMMQPFVDFPNDPGNTNLWALEPFSSNGAGIDITTAWGKLPALDNESGDSPKEVVVAVLDTGITDHPDLNDNILPGYDMISSTRVSVDGDGRDSDPSDPGDAGRGQDSSWHGTHVAGTIAARTNNNTGITGVGGNHIKVVPVRVLGKGGGYTSDIVDGIYWAAGLGPIHNNNPANVINMSLGGSASCDPNSSYQAAINAAIEANVTVVVAAGKINADASGFIPASCTGVITVAATGDNGARAYYSNYGATIEVAAPGGDMRSGQGILSTINLGSTSPTTSGYAFYQGTSMASPHAAAVAALLYAKFPSITPDEVRFTLQGTANSVGCVDAPESCGAGLIDAGKALGVTEPLTSYTPTSGTGGSGGGDTGTGGEGETSGQLVITVAPVVDIIKASRFSITWTTNTLASSEVTINGQTFRNSELVTSHKQNFRGTKGVTYNYSVSSEDANGNRVSATGESFTL